MGAFFLHKKHSNLLLEETGKIFIRKGFSEPKTIALGDWVLWIYRKQALDVDNLYIAKDGLSVFCCGTVVYRRLGYRDSLRRVLDDFREKRLDQNELLGNFCLLFWDGRNIAILTDRLNVQHLFFNESRTCLSSSFLAVLAASPNPLPLNRLAVYEKLATGYIISPDTLVEGIYQLDDENGRKLGQGNPQLSFINHLERPPVRMHDNGLEDSLERQMDVLEKHFRSVDAIHTECSGELGLSSGYDSRLVLSCGKFLSEPLSIHTHATIGVHDAEATVARKITSDMNMALKEVTTHKMTEQTKEAVEKILEDGLYFFDGRCAHDMGAFSETYTRAYKLKVLGNHKFSWSGLGGEIFRNCYLTWRQSVILRNWMAAHIYYPFSNDAIGDKEISEEVHHRKIQKISRRLGDHFLKPQVSFVDLRRYYSEIRMPDCNAINNNAHNQIAFFHTPFFDSSIVYEGIDATPFIGCDGTYQAALIKRLNPKLASYPSHYGHPFDNVPLKYILKCWVRGKLPDTLLHKRARIISRQRGLAFAPKFMAFMDANPILSEIRYILGETVLKGRFEDAMLDYAQRPTTIFVGSFLREFQHKMKW